MAIEVFPDSPSTVERSPRISFSHDLSQTDIVPVEQYIRSSSSTSSVDFDFCVFRESFEQESSSADELFFDGKILPIEIKKRLAPATLSKRAAPPVPPPPPSPPPAPDYDQIIGPIKSSKKIPTESEEKQNSSKSFWRFKRSTSLNCGSGYARTLCPLPILSRSNSTGSTTSTAKRSSMKQANATGTHHRPPLKKSTHVSNNYANINYGIRINPVLNVRPANLFGFGSIFLGGNKGKKK